MGSHPPARSGESPSQKLMSVLSKNNASHWDVCCKLRSCSWSSGGVIVESVDIQLMEMGRCRPEPTRGCALGRSHHPNILTISGYATDTEWTDRHTERLLAIVWLVYCCLTRAKVRYHMANAICVCPVKVMAISRPFKTGWFVESSWTPSSV